MLQLKLSGAKLKKKKKKKQQQHIIKNKKKKMDPLIPIKKKILEAREHQDLVPS